MFLMENPIKMDDDWGYHHFGRPPYGNIMGISLINDIDKLIVMVRTWGLYTIIYYPSSS